MGKRQRPQGNKHCSAEGCVETVRCRRSRCTCQRCSSVVVHACHLGSQSLIAKSTLCAAKLAAYCSSARVQNRSLRPESLCAGPWSSMHYYKFLRCLVVDMVLWVDLIFRDPESASMHENCLTTSACGSTISLCSGLVPLQNHVSRHISSST
jgi:hypothetical protein